MAIPNPGHFTQTLHLGRSHFCKHLRTRWPLARRARRRGLSWTFVAISLNPKSLLDQVILIGMERIDDFGGDIVRVIFSLKPEIVR